MQHRGKGEVTGAVCCKARKTHKKSEPGLLAVRRELCQHGLAAGLAQVPSRASAVSPKPHRFHLVPPPGYMLAMCMCCPAWVHPSLQGRGAEAPPELEADPEAHPKCWCLGRETCPLTGASARRAARGDSECHRDACQRWQERDDLLGKQPYKKHTGGSCLLSRTLQTLHG